MEMIRFSIQDVIILCVSFTAWIFLFALAQNVGQKTSAWDKFAVFVLITTIAFAPFVFLLVSD